MAPKQSIFDRLNDPSTFQASHQARFADRPDVKNDHIALKPGHDIKTGGDIPTRSSQPSSARKDTAVEKAPQPMSSRTKPVAASKAGGGSIYDRLNDPSTFQASHQARFAERPDVKNDHVQLKPGHDINTGGDMAAVPVKKTAAVPAKPAASAASKTQDASKPKPAAKGGSIFDKLTDSSQYTGTHAHRFDADGKGKGLTGRDSVSKGNGTGTGNSGELSAQLCRK